MKSLLVIGFATVTALWIVAGAVGSTPPGGVFGTVVIVPGCPGPVVQGSVCERPVSAPVQARRNGRLVATTKSDAKGIFRLHLRAGTYVLRAVPTSRHARSQAVRVVVKRSTFVRVKLEIDVGIR